MVSYPLLGEEGQTTSGQDGEIGSSLLVAAWRMLLLWLGLKQDRTTH